MNILYTNPRTTQLSGQASHSACRRLCTVPSCAQTHRTLHNKLPCTWCGCAQAHHTCCTPAVQQTKADRHFQLRQRQQRRQCGRCCCGRLHQQQRALLHPLVVLHHLPLPPAAAQGCRRCCCYLYCFCVAAASAEAAARACCRLLLLGAAPSAGPKAAGPIPPAGFCKGMGHLGGGQSMPFPAPQLSGTAATQRNQQSDSMKGKNQCKRATELAHWHKRREHLSRSEKSTHNRAQMRICSTAGVNARWHTLCQHSSWESSCEHMYVQPPPAH